MNQEEIIRIVSEKLKLIRTEYNLTQEQMSEVVGISKKTLVQIEKQRVQCGWTVAVAMCTLFKSSAILQAAFGGNSLIFIGLSTGEGVLVPEQHLVNDKLWWRTIESEQNWRIQQNLVHTSFRLLNPANEIKLYTLSKEDAEDHLASFTTI
ncbi:helix-turn-helix transcriptional regulator [Kurthia zopfii]|uniref:helix-turn-helix transcriptional regulator n=1 Tax=Kurthia zopfii TaxID=1650 RepID=UPI000F71D5F7|nr:helix-turn-helix domain-containing protein [Kurthia zopfii]VEI05272.1 Helix-turn-helix domain [Kurthia zopfii]